MKIVYFSPHPHLNLSASAGYATHMREVINAFQQKGHTVEKLIIGGEELASNIDSQKKSFVKKMIKQVFPKVIWNTVKDYQLQQIDKASYLRLKNLVEKEKPDLIYERGAPFMKSGVRIAQEYNIAHYLEINAPFSNERKKMEGNSLLKSTCEQTLKNTIYKTSKLIVVSSALKDFFINAYGVSPEKIIVTPNAINPESIKIQKSTTQVKESLKIPLTNKVIGFVGSIFPYHGVDILIQSFAEIVKNHTDIYLLIVGDGYVLGELKDLTYQLQISDKVIFTGSIPHTQVYNYIQIMDITVMARSNWYGSPVKIFEYGAMGKAIIAPDNVPIRDVMEPNIDGILITDTVSSIKDALLKFLNDDSLRIQTGKNFQQKTINHHTWSQVAEKILLN